MSVAIAPGAIPLILIPLSANSKAAVLVNNSIPPLEAAYGADSGLGVSSWTEEILIIE
jgi:hypothetical protein